MQVYVDSNHTREEDTHIMRFLSRHNVPYHYVPTNKEGRSEEEIMNLVHGTDFLVLAHYMQVHSMYAFWKLFSVNWDWS
jgi:formyltetrahydrofolate deformylase